MSQTSKPAPGTSSVHPIGIVQTAYYVDDARAAATRWSQRFGAGPFFVLDHIALQDVVVRGEASTFDHTSAYGWQNNVMVELVQQNCSTPSIFNDRAFGLHHLAHFVDSVPRALARYADAGLATAMRAQTQTGTEFAFVDATASHGHFFEIYEPNDGLQSFYHMVEQAADHWDGRDPVRTLG